MPVLDPFQSLSTPYRRDELILYLRELAMPDPRPLWREEMAKGLVADIDQVFHFFFDDNDFHDSAIGVTLLNHAEVAVMENLKAALDAILSDVGDAGDDVFLQHPLWLSVTAAASNALKQLAMAS